MNTFIKSHVQSLDLKPKLELSPIVNAQPLNSTLQYINKSFVKRPDQPIQQVLPTTYSQADFVENDDVKPVFFHYDEQNEHLLNNEQLTLRIIQIKNDLKEASKKHTYLKGQNEQLRLQLLQLMQNDLKLELKQQHLIDFQELTKDQTETGEIQLEMVSLNLVNIEEFNKELDKDYNNTHIEIQQMNEKIEAELVKFNKIETGIEGKIKELVKKICLMKYW